MNLIVQYHDMTEEKLTMKKLQKDTNPGNYIKSVST